MDLDLNAFGKWVSKNGKDIVVTWFSVLTRGPRAFEDLDLEKSSTLLYALAFMLYMALVDLVVHIPLAAKIGVNLQSGFFILCFVVEYYIEFLATGLILYGAMKLLGGKGALQACIAAYCLLTAYMPLISVLMLPTQMLTVPAFAQGSSFPQILDQFAAQAGQLSTWDRSSLLLSLLLTTVVFVLFFKSIFETFRTLHRLSKARAIFAFMGGLVCTYVFMAMFVIPLLSAIYHGLGLGAVRPN
jgi:hypothetical protein